MSGNLYFSVQLCLADAVGDGSTQNDRACHGADRIAKGEIELRRNQKKMLLAVLAALSLTAMPIPGVHADVVVDPNTNQVIVNDKPIKGEVTLNGKGNNESIWWDDKNIIESSSSIFGNNVIGNGNRLNESVSWAPIANNFIVGNKNEIARGQNNTIWGNDNFVRYLDGSRLIGARNKIYGSMNNDDEGNLIIGDDNIQKQNANNNQYSIDTIIIGSNNTFDGSVAKRNTIIGNKNEIQGNNIVALGNNITNKFPKPKEDPENPGQYIPGEYIPGELISVGQVDAVAIGNDIQVRSGAVVLGGETISGENSVTIGYNAKNNNAHSIAIGYSGKVQSGYVSAMGTQVQVGLNSQSGIAIGNFATIGDNAMKSIAIGASGGGYPEEKTVIKDGAMWSIAMGTKSSVGENATQSIAIGGYNATIADNTNKAIALGTWSHVSGEQGSALGYNAGVSKIYGTAIGSYSNVSGEYGTTLGSYSSVVATNGTALGALANVSAKNGTALGYDTQVSASHGVALGDWSTATENDILRNYQSKFDWDAKNDMKVMDREDATGTVGVISIGSSSGDHIFTRRITNVSNGRIADGSTDAVNGNQLYHVWKNLYDQIVNPNKDPAVNPDSAGGDASGNTGGGTSGSSSGGSTGSETGITGGSSGETSGSTGENAKDVLPNPVDPDRTDNDTKQDVQSKSDFQLVNGTKPLDTDVKDEKGNTIATTGYKADKNGNVLLNIRDKAGADGDAATERHVVIADVASKAQQDINTNNIENNRVNIEKNTTAITNLNGRVNDLSGRVNKVGAGAAALAALHPLDFDPDEKLDFAAGYGNYGGENAVALGAYYRPNEDTMFSLGGTFGNGENMVNAGISFKLGQKNRISVSRVAMAKEIIELRKQLEDLRSLMADMATGRTLDLSKIQLFPDIPENHWAYDYVTTLAGNGLLEGYPDGEYKGNRQLTRYEMAAILYRAMLNGAKLTDRALSEFAPELDRIRVDTITKGKDGLPDIQRVRTIPGRE